jgi:hypothetical protein
MHDSAHYGEVIELPQTAAVWQLQIMAANNLQHYVMSLEARV